MKKYVAIAALALTLGVAAKPAQAGQPVLHGAGAPWALKAAVFAVGAMTVSVMLQAIIVSNTQKRQLTLEEGQYAALLPFLWTVHPLALPKKKKR
jgi:hypothetical protein